jgi:hypothetical protein
VAKEFQATLPKIKNGVGSRQNKGFLGLSLGWA